MLSSVTLLHAGKSWAVKPAVGDAAGSSRMSASHPFLPLSDLLGSR